jgi:hypothetical protein
LPNQSGHACLVAHVHPNGNRLASLLANPLANLRRRFFVEVGDDNLQAVAGQFLTNLRSDSPGAAGDDYCAFHNGRDFYRTSERLTSKDSG